ncbi:organic solute transporter alpha-like protein [Aricia agestis]|uniref:organic solute transporter alpha-like protein n=1 Tax=Aricia agestis TaxID=91739 RepID=UPI001C20AC35|nr:organic solute transporter alpha-like protein [Aricia agestis]
MSNMDLMSEPSNGRVLTARHISGKSLPEENSINATFICNSHDIQPDFFTYLAGLQPYAWVIWSCGGMAVLAICVMYVVTLRAALRIWRDSALSVAIVLSVYPLVAALALLVTILPRTRILCEAISQEIVMVALYHFFNLVIAECGGVNQLIARSAGAQLETRTLPCCCWPCCILPRPQVHKKSLTWMRYLVLQVPIIQGILFFIVLVLRAEAMELYSRSMVYIQPFVAASILSGVWGIIMSLKAAESVGLSPRARFLVLQLVLIIVKLQFGIAKSLPGMVSMPCIMAMNPSVFVNLVQNIVTIFEMLLLSLCAWRLYKIPPTKNVEKMNRIVVAVLDDSVSSTEKEIADKSEER